MCVLVKTTNLVNYFPLHEMNAQENVLYSSSGFEDFTALLEGLLF